MIARVWKGYATPEKAPEYAAHLEQGVVPELRTIDGFQGVYLMSREVDGLVELTVTTLWESMNAIHQFAGANAETAVVAPTAQAVLHHFDATVRHHEVILHE